MIFFANFFDFKCQISGLFDDFLAFNIRFLDFWAFNVRIKINYQERMLEGEVFAIETFPTTGNGSIYELKECNHYMIEPKDFTNIQDF